MLVFNGGRCRVFFAGTLSIIAIAAYNSFLGAADVEEPPETRTGRFQFFDTKLGTWDDYGHRLEALAKRTGMVISPEWAESFKKGRAEDIRKEADAKAAAVKGQEVVPDPPKPSQTPDYEVYVSPAYTPAVPAGLIVWEGGAEDVALPAGWEQVMDDRNILWIGPHGTGNEKDVLWRGYMALDSVRQMKKHFAIVEERIYMCGISGGGRVASRMGVMAADTFAGFFSDVGADFYTEYWHTPDARILRAPRPTAAASCLREGKISIFKVRR